MAVIDAEERAVRSVLERVQKLEAVADDIDAEQAGVLREVVAMEWDAAAPVRPRVAASILGLSEKTVRAWERAGLLTVAVREPRVLLDPERLLTVLRLVRDLREAGRQQGLLDEVWRRVNDAEMSGRADVQEGLAQARRGEFSEPLFHASEPDRGRRARWDRLR